MIGRVEGEQKQTKKKTVKRNRDSSCCCAFTLAYKRKGGEGQKRLLYKAKLCYRDQIGPFKSCLLESSLFLVVESGCLGIVKGFQSSLFYAVYFLKCQL